MSDGNGETAGKNGLLEYELITFLCLHLCSAAAHSHYNTTF